jgi:3'(2'), 5'-bisphosphate nucleotidase
MPMIWSHHSREAEFALQAVRTAAGVCEVVRREAGVAPWRKADTSPVTVADFASQALVAGRLAEAFPGDALIAEEDSRTLESDPAALAQVVKRLRVVRPEADAGRARAWIDRGSGEAGDRFWTLDPVDGTKGFLRGGQYVVALALIEGGVVVVAALAAPSLGVDLQPLPSSEGCVVIAVRGDGAWVLSLDGGGGRRLCVSECDSPSDARLLSSVENTHTDPEQLARLTRRLGLTAEPIRLDSQAKHLVIAGGQAEVLIRFPPHDRPSYKEKLWDVAAGLLVVEEAGGRATDLDGRALDLMAGRELRRNRGILISNGRLHEAALGAVMAAQGETPA